jgi:hypothetical protein
LCGQGEQNDREFLELASSCVEEEEKKGKLPFLVALLLFFFVCLARVRIRALLGLHPFFFPSQKRIHEQQRRADARAERRRRHTIAFGCTSP